MSKVIPDYWKEITVQECCEILDNQRIPLNSDERYLMKGDIPYYGANGVVDWINDYIFDQELILIAEDGGNFEDYENRAIAYKISGKSWVNNHAHILKVKLEYDYNFIFYSLEHKNVINVIKGGTRSKLNQSELKEIQILSPKNVIEQQKIASILENVDNNIDKTQEIIEKYEMMKQGLMHDLFNKGIDENGKPHTEFKDSELGIIPNNWDEVTLESVISKILDFRGKTPKKIGMEWGNGEITALSANNVEMGNINFEKETYYGSEDLYDKWMNRGDCEFKDIIMTMEAPLGNIAQIPDNRRYILSQRVILFKLNINKVKNDYLAHFLRSDYFQGQLIKYSSGTTAKGIQQSQLLKLKVKIPKLISEQNKISEVLNSIEDKIQSEKKYLYKLQKIKTGLMQDLLTGKVRVKT